MDKAARDNYFNELMKKTYDKIYTFVGKGCGDREFVEDVVQETFYEAYRKIDILMVHPNQMGWLYETAKNKRMKLGKKRGEFYLLEGEVDNLGAENAEEYEEVELAESIKASVSER